MDKIVSAPWFALGLFAGMLLAFGVGWRTGGRRKSGENSSLSGAIDSAIFGLFSLLVAFTFSGAAERYDHRRQLIAEETNNIGTAWLRVDLLSTSDQLPVRELSGGLPPFRAVQCGSSVPAAPPWGPLRLPLRWAARFPTGCRGQNW